MQPFAAAPLNQRLTLNTMHITPWASLILEPKQFQKLMQKAAAQTQSSQKEAAELIAQRDAAQRKARLEQEARETKEREARKAQLLHEMESRRKAEEEAARKEQRERDRAQSDADRQRDSHSWATALYSGKGKAGSSSSSATNKPIKQVQEHSDRSRVCIRIHLCVYFFILLMWFRLPNFIFFPPCLFAFVLPPVALIDIIPTAQSCPRSIDSIKRRETGARQSVTSRITHRRTSEVRRQ